MRKTRKFHKRNANQLDPVGVIRRPARDKKHPAGILRYPARFILFMIALTLCAPARGLTKNEPVNATIPGRNNVAYTENAAKGESPAIRQEKEESPATQQEKGESPAIQQEKEESPATQQEKEESPAIHQEKEDSRRLPATQQETVTVKGVVKDASNVPLPGVHVTVSGSTRGVTTDLDGSFSINVLPTDQLKFSFIGMQDQTIAVGAKRELTVVMLEKTDELEGVTVVAFGQQKKESVVSAIQTVHVRDLKVPSSNLTTAFSGRIAGMIAYQSSGEPGQDNAEFFIRGITSFGTGKVDPLILVDNVEMTTHDLSRLHPDDIASFSILKDATATALYGARGANGVVMVTTKEGREGSVKVSLRLENSTSAATKKLKMADAITYMDLANEAAVTRGLQPVYSMEKIENTINNTNPYVYPNVDWTNMLTKKIAHNQRYNLNISGGGTVARYYIAFSFSQDNGILKVDHRNNFNNNIDLKKYLIRSNININLTPSTEAIVRLHGTFDDYNGPLMGGGEMFRRTLNVSPVRFPAHYAPDAQNLHVTHILFGGVSGNNYYNPYADLMRGFREESITNMLAQFELKQDFNEWIPGLTGRLLGNTNRYSAFDMAQAYNPFYYDIERYDKRTNTYTLYNFNHDSGKKYMTFYPGYKAVNSSFYAEASLLYNRAFGKHSTSAMLVGMIRNQLNGNAGSLFDALPQRNLGMAGRFTYDYDTRYLAEFNFGYNGSERFAKNHRWGFFPSFGVGWVASNEAFWQESWKKYVSKLKFRATYGLVGNDGIGGGRYFYLSEVGIGGGWGYATGKAGSGQVFFIGPAVKTYANNDITWEIARKTNLGVELGLFDGKVEILADFFTEQRRNIVMDRVDMPAEMGAWYVQKTNAGKVSGRGADISIDYNHSINENWWLVGRANFTFARATFQYYEEVNYAKIGAPWLLHKGQYVSQYRGFVAERLFMDDADIKNSAQQNFGQYLPGDIKYKDVNRDGLINNLDMVPLGKPQTPEINYGFGLSAGYKNVDLSVFFSGLAQRSFWIDPGAMAPFVKTGVDIGILENGLAQFIADDHWTEQNQNIHAAWPRLSDYGVVNNYQPSSWWMRDGSFLRLKSAELGYSLPKRWIEPARVASCRLYLSGTNLLLFSKFKLWDIEMGGSGLGYPLQRVFNLGLNIDF
jgi:TonB-linked SusC/RagA family outer membrane protein